MIENITEFNIYREDRNSTLELALHYRPLKKRKVLIEKLKELEVQKEAADENSTKLFRNRIGK